jgi:hypothetical protein
LRDAYDQGVIDVQNAPADAGFAAAPSPLLSGEWDRALRLTPDGPDGAALRAEILIDRDRWRLDPPGEGDGERERGVAPGEIVARAAEELDLVWLKADR